MRSSRVSFSPTVTVLRLEDEEVDSATADQLGEDSLRRIGRTTSAATLLRRATTRSKRRPDGGMDPSDDDALSDGRIVRRRLE